MAGGTRIVTPGAELECQRSGRCTRLWCSPESSCSRLWFIRSSSPADPRASGHVPECAPRPMLSLSGHRPGHRPALSVTVHLRQTQPGSISAGHGPESGGLFRYFMDGPILHLNIKDQGRGYFVMAGSLTSAWPIAAAGFAVIATGGRSSLARYAAAAVLRDWIRHPR
jgi:hypothetical protein